MAACHGYTLDGTEAAVDPGFAAEMERRTGVTFLTCYQCLTCTLGCPLSWAMDHPPNEIIRLVQQGLREEVLRSGSIQICSACETCVTRCPNGIEIAELIDGLRTLAFEEGHETREPTVRKFHRAFLGGFRNYGRVHEIGFVMRLKLSTLALFQDVWVGTRMFFKGKFALLPHKIRDRKLIRRIFEKTLERKASS